MTRFTLNEDLLASARRTLGARRRLYWVVGGAATGKSTVCQAIAQTRGIAIYDMDERLYGDYPQRCSRERHPVLSEWFGAPDSFAWLLGLSEPDFAAFNQASTAEILDVLAAELANRGEHDALLVDGGITNPALAARVIPPAQMACLATSPGMSARVWEEDASRQWVREMVGQFPDGKAAWQRFLRFDRLISETIVDECRRSHIRIFPRDDTTSAPHLAQVVAQHLGI